LETTLPIEDPARQDALYGTADRNLRLIRTAFDVRISARNGSVHLKGTAESVKKAAFVLDELQRALRQSAVLTDEQVEETIRQGQVEGAESGLTRLQVFLSSASISPKSIGQRKYIDTIASHDLTFCVGPAGTGKTYLAVASSVSMLKQHKIQRIVLVRPAVEAGEKLGYLPGDLQAKVNPYLRPLFDAMHDTMTFDQIRRFMQNDVIEVVPLAFMRGRTLNNAAIILDEAQNATASQMLMFLTRMGQNSKMIVAGDDSQSDLENGETRGLIDAVERLDGIPGIGVVRLSRTDIVRHTLVQRVVEAYGDGVR
jgi:phosphate starvation-inducible PhoH-like protein